MILVKRSFRRRSSEDAPVRTHPVRPWRCPRQRSLGRQHPGCWYHPQTSAPRGHPHHPPQQPVASAPPASASESSANCSVCCGDTCPAGHAHAAHHEGGYGSTRAALSAGSAVGLRGTCWMGWRGMERSTLTVRDPSGETESGLMPLHTPAIPATGGCPQGKWLLTSTQE